MLLSSVSITVTHFCMTVQCTKNTVYTCIHMALHIPIIIYCFDTRTLNFFKLRCALAAYLINVFPKVIFTPTH